MRKVVIGSIMLFLVILQMNIVHASDYLSYQDMEFEHKGMLFLDDYTDRLYKKYFVKVDKKKFIGWRTYTAHKTEKVYYTKETLYVIYNEGDTAITQTFKFKNSQTVKKQYNVSGGIGLNVDGVIEGFKLGLESKLDHSITATTTNSIEEEINIKVFVDPHTKLDVQIKGEAQVSNGVAAYYFFWHRTDRGGWEVFTVTTEYYSLKKHYIDGYQPSEEVAGEE